MTVSAKAYSHMPLSALEKLMDLGTGNDVIKCMLCTSSYIPDQDADEFKDDVDNEVSGGNYTATGATIASSAVTTTGTVTKFDGLDVEWADSTITARYAVIYDSSPGTDAERPLLIYVDFEEDKSSEAGTFKIAWNESGIFTITVAA